MTDDNWGPWFEWQGGECPIPNVLSTNWKLRQRNGEEHGPNCWSPLACGWENTGRPNDITHYRLRKPVVDWEALAREAVKELNVLSLTAFRAEGGKLIGPTDGDLYRLEAFLDRARKAGIE